MDREGKGEIGYDEFTLLTEERWRGIDPFQQLKNNISNKQSTEASLKSANRISNLQQECDNELEFLERLESLSKNKLKIPLKKEVKIEN